MSDTQAELHARRAGSFGSQAGQYAEHRPDYPAAAIDWVLPGGVSDVLDLAAGTGKLTGSLIDLGLAVTAVEPDAAMLGELRKRFPSATALIGTAERIPLDDCSVDAVLVGQAFHWFDVPKALDEIGRVLRPGGRVGALWNYEDDRVPWVSGFDAMVRTGVSRDWAYPAPLPDHRLFEPFEREEFEHSVRRTAETLVAMVGTHSHMLVAGAGERASINARMREYLKAQPETADGEFDLPLRTFTYRANRLISPAV
ncbi:SAM-dependent methyltransferase [Kibdelosporangium banguiense]|uniref:SAM-dependent methyltransferase n=1 Tax=Kibdelosporangium banguiense TaxID=1365924 RepID=A0ABS4TA91_9PSEU|nr:class I SAM-dependent methyltransferase [Kibdelosporangium banguiense]MBP2321337.1 SAM-dependent methyltransferase [Kibdelosporangium banguiense]